MTSRTMKFDVLMATDCRFPGGNTSSVVEEIEAQHRAGYRTGVLHLPSPVLEKPRPFAEKLRQVIDEGKAELVLGADRIEAGLLLARHPTVFTEPPRGLPQLDVEHVLLAVNQVASDDRGVLPYYDVRHVHRQIERMAGKEATWAPIGPRVRESLEPHTGSVPVLPWDWENVIDVTSWEVERTGFVSDRPVIGRHSRGHWSKWPDSKRDILAAYPADPRYHVRILGGTKAPGQILERIPPNWVDLPFNSVPARDFLASIDFFVYFHHPGLIEAFGRVVLEALSAGAVVIGPRYLEQLFGDACLYGTPADVRGYVDQLYGDWPAFAARSQAGVELARKRFSYETHADRIRALIGEPSAPHDDGRPTTGTPVKPGRSGKAREREYGEPGEQGAASRRPRRNADRSPTADTARPSPPGTMVVDLRWDTSDADVLTRVVEQVVAEPGVCTVVVPAWRADYLGEWVASRKSGNPTSTRSSKRNRPAEIVVETFPWVLAEMSAAERRRYVALRASGLLETHRPARLVLVDGGQDARVVLDVVGDSDVDVVRIQRESAPAMPPVPGRLPEGSADASSWSLPDGWTATYPPRASVRVSGRESLLVRWRRRAPARMRTWARQASSWYRRVRVSVLERVAPRSGLVLFEAYGGPLSLPVRAPVTHPTPGRLPVALLVVVSQDAEPEPTLRALVERAQMTAQFRPAVLAPPSWVEAAVSYGVTLETLVPQEVWSSAHGEGWSAYLRRRVDETSQVIQPSVVGFTEHTVPPAGSGTAGRVTSAVLDVLEAARTRQRA